jgi:hypothetical protein
MGSSFLSWNKTLVLFDGGRRRVRIGILDCKLFPNLLNTMCSVGYFGREDVF